jgi:uncharacterized damage-inducible protein DinB
MREVVRVFEAEFNRYKALGDATFAQLGDDEVSRRPPGGGNSVAIIVWHVGGNLESRFTDFLTTDGEKPWRDRDQEFEARVVTAAEVLAKWERGWRAVAEALASLDDDRLTDRVTIRSQGLSVIEALARSLAHTANHVGQIVFLGKMWRGDAWNCLSIPLGASRTYNANPGSEKPADHAAAMRARRPPDAGKKTPG